MLALWGCVPYPKFTCKKENIGYSRSVETIEPTVSKRLSTAQKKVVDAAKSYLGVRYKLGGNDRFGMDCSGLVQRVFRDALVMKLPRTVEELWKLGKSISFEELEPGDLVFFSPGSENKRYPTHVGIYIGNYKFIHASESSGVRIDSLVDPFWKGRFFGARRIIRKF